MKLKPYKFNDEFFELLKGTDYEALKRDIEKRGIKTALHILNDGTVICGNQRLRVARELSIPDEKIPIKIVKLDSPEEIKEYVIKDNLLRRHLRPEQRAFLVNELSEVYEIGRGGDRVSKDDKLASLEQEDVNEKTAKEVNESPRNIARFRAYVKAVNKNPEYKGQKISVVLRDLKIKKEKAEVEKLEPEKEIQGVFDVIVIDPPWNYKDHHYDADSNRGTTPYPTMEIDDIAKIKLPTAENCILWLWTTNTFIHEAFHLLEWWGFLPKTILTWDKQILGVGRWLRSQTEHCILAIKGKPPWDNKKYTTSISEKRTTHSTKPEAFYKMVEEICYGRKLDYFATKKREGWEVYGNITEKKHIL